MGPRIRPLALAALILLATLAVFGPVLGFEFVAFDDGYYVSENAHVKGGLSLDGVVWAFTTDTLMNWHPLTWLSFMLDHELFGLDPGGYHAVSLLLHTLNALLLFGVLRAMTGADVPSALVALLFAVHPLRVESVAWISERKDVLCAFFGLLCIGAYTRWTRRGGWGRYSVVGLLLALGLLAKPMLVTLPFVLVLLDRWPLERRISLRRSLLEKLPLLAICAAAALVTYSLQRSGGSMASGAELSIAARSLNAVHAYAVYVARSFWPGGLGPLYPHPYLPEAGGIPLPAVQLFAAAALLVGISGLVWRFRRVAALPIGWLWFLGMLVPTIGLVQVGHQALADRYTYLPQIGLWLAIVWGVGEAAQARPYWRKPALAAAALAAVGFALVSGAQVGHWRDSRALFEHAVAVAPRSPDMRTNLGLSLQRAGELESAALQYRHALEVAPDSEAALFNLAGLLVQRGELEPAVAHYRRALEVAPEQAIVHRNLGSALRAQGHDDEALAHYRTALSLDADDVLGHLNLAGLLHSRGRLDEAVEHYRRATELAPDFADAHTGLGIALGARGDLDAAVIHLRRALALRPDHGEAQARLRYALNQRSRKEAAADPLAAPGDR